jgi:hypothetical protein
MSVKFERDTFRQGAAATSGAAGAGGIPGIPGIPGLSGVADRMGGPLPGTSGKHPIAEAVGTAVTGGKESAGTKGYLAVCATRDGVGGKKIVGWMMRKMLMGNGDL